jgi:DNA repair exonuclease SbcCD nuclease subunit
MRILHLADVHLDRPFSGLSRAGAAARRRGLREAVSRALGLAAEHGAGLVTIGGDLWEDEHVTADTRAWLAGALEACGLPVVLIAGNHDPLTPGGPHERTAWPPNVRLLPAGRLSEAAFDDVSVWGASWGPAPFDPGALLARFRVPDDGRRHLLLIHGTADGHGAPGEDRAGFFTAEAIAAAGFERCLAGHIHRPSAEGLVVYPGSPEPLGRGETGRHCVALVDAGAVRLLDVNEWRQEDRSVNCEGAASSAQVAARLSEALAVERPECAFVRVTLRGEVDRGVDVDPAALRAAHEERFAGLEIRDLTRRPYDLDALAAAPTALGRFVAALGEREGAAADEDERERLALALDLGVRAMHEDEVLPHVD